MGGSRTGPLEIQSTTASFGKVDDDGFKPLTVEMYIKGRLLPLIAEHQYKAPQLETANDLLTLVVLLASISTAGLASLKQELWVPVIIGLQHAAESIKNYRGYPSRLEANNTVLSELNKELVKWYGLAISDQRLLFNRTALIESCEASYLNEIMKRVASFRSKAMTSTDAPTEPENALEASSKSGSIDKSGGGSDGGSKAKGPHDGSTSFSKASRKAMGDRSRATPTMV